MNIDWKRWAGRIINALFYLLIVICIFLMFVVVAQRQGEESNGLGGHQAYVVMSGSMVPTFNTGSLILVKDTPIKDIESGDIITYSVGGSIVTHRVVESTQANGETQLITQGDANNAPDQLPVRASDLKGRAYFWVNGLGFFLLWLKKPTSLLLVGSFVLALLLASWLLNRKKTKGENQNGASTISADSRRL